MVKVKDANNCGTPFILVIYIPNVFTPNNGRTNDYFEIFGNKDAFHFIEIKVFDRRGEKVFESNNLNFKWDGTYKGGSLTPSVFICATRSFLTIPTKAKKFTSAALPL